MITLSDPESDRIIEQMPTLQCCHCGFTWAYQPGSGRIRGWCMKCHGPVCGPRCAECVPKERQLENIEAGRPLKTPSPAMVQVFGGLFVPGE